MKKYLFFVLILIYSKGQAQTPYFIWGRGSAQLTNQGLGQGLSVTTFGSNDIYIAGYYNDSISFPPYLLNGHEGVYLAKYDSSGNLKWVRGGHGHLSNTPFGFAIATDPSGNIYFTGAYKYDMAFGSYNFSCGQYDAFIVKYDSTGNLLWAKSTKDPSYARAAALKTDQMGNVYITGEFANAVIIGPDTIHASCTMCWDVFVAKLDPSGNPIWAKNINTTGACSVFGLSLDSNANCYLTGTYERSSFVFASDTLIFNGYPPNMYVIKYNSQGNEIWGRAPVNNSNYINPTNCVCDNSGNIYLTGYFTSTISFSGTPLVSAGVYDIYLIKYDSNGNLIRARSYGNVNHDTSYGLAIDSFANIYMTGEFSIPNIAFDTCVVNHNAGYNDALYITRFDSSGQAYFGIGLPSGGAAQSGIAISTSGDIYVTGAYGNYYQTQKLILGNDTLRQTGILDVFLAKIGLERLSGTNVDEYQSDNLNIYPNPFHSYLKIDHNFEKVEITIYDALSNKIIQKNISEPELIETDELKAGIYILRIKYISGRISHYKIIKQ